MNSFELLSDLEASIERQQRKDANTASTNGKKSSDEANGQLVNVIENHLYAVFISCIEIYNNYIYDLLDSDSK
jgi:hypothetical protein